MMQELAKYFNVTVSDLVDLPNDNSNTDLSALREQLRRQPGMRVLFDAAEGATPEQLEQFVKVIKALKNDDD